MIKKTNINKTAFKSVIMILSILITKITTPVNFFQPNVLKQNAKNVPVFNIKTESQK